MGARPVLALLVVLPTVVSCGRLGFNVIPDGAADSSADAHGDSSPDAAPDARPDAPPDADRWTDADPEPPVDSSPDAEGDAPPALNLEAIVDRPSVLEGTPMDTVDAHRVSGGDTTSDGTPITYSCTFDRDPSGDVPAGQACAELSAHGDVSFDGATGVLDFTPGLGQLGSYEVRIEATAGALTDDELFLLVVVRDDRPTALAVGDTVLVSRGLGGAMANGASSGHTVGLSASGRFVVYTSEASNLVADDTNGVADTFVTDLLDGSTIRASVSSDGAEGDGPSDGSAVGASVSGIGISDDSYSVVFISAATNLVAGDTNGAVDVFVFDRRTEQTRRVSVDSSGAQGDGHCQRAQISGDGRYVAYQSAATNLVGGDTNLEDDCFRHDLVTGQTVLISQHDDGTSGNDSCYHPRISSDGNLVAFTSSATNLIDGDVNGFMDSFVRDVSAGTTVSVSRRQSDGVQCDEHSWSACFSGDQAFITFHGFATNLLSAGAENATVEDIFQLRRSDGFISLVSESDHAVAEPADDRCYVSRQSHTGRYVSFNSLATNLLEGSTIDNGFMDVFVKDTVSGAVSWASQAWDGGLSDGPSDRAYVSRDGTHVAYESLATNLVDDDTNGVTDIYVHRFR